jgi:O-acetyl-ADP-ribose deacetylase (regulator of RNase III)
MDLAASIGARTLAFPAISTGVYGYPREEAAAIALREVAAGLRRHAAVARVTLCCFSAGDLAACDRIAAATL